MTSFKINNTASPHRVAKVIHHLFRHAAPFDSLAQRIVARIERRLRSQHSLEAVVAALSPAVDLKCLAVPYGVASPTEKREFLEVSRRSLAAVRLARSWPRNLRINLLELDQPIAMTAIGSLSKAMVGEDEMYCGKRSTLQAQWARVTSRGTTRHGRRAGGV